MNKDQEKIDKEETISVIVPIYNVSKYISRCIKSILSQTYHNLEIMLIDDGSTDNSLEICKSFAEKDHRIKIIHQENSGLSATRNVGLDMATGELIAFVDSDDYIHPEMYERLVSNLLKYKAEISQCSFKYIRILEEEVKNNIYKVSENFIKQYTGEAIIKERFLYNEPVMTTSCNKVYRKGLWEDVRFLEGQNFEDEATIFKVFYKAHKTVISDFQGYYYCQRYGSITNSKYTIQNAEEQMKAVKVKYQYFKENAELEKIVKVSCAIKCIEIWNKLYKDDRSKKKELKKIYFLYKTYSDIRLSLKYLDFVHIIKDVLFLIEPKMEFFFSILYRKFIKENVDE